MSDIDPDVLVLDGDDRPPPPGAAAVFQGMLSVLGEELEELHRGMAAVERNVADARAESRATPAMVAEQVEQALDRRLAVLATTLGAQAPRQELYESVAVIDVRLERLEAVVADGAAEAAGALEAVRGIETTVVRGLAALEERLVASLPRHADDGGELQRSVIEVLQRLDTLERSRSGDLEELSARIEGLGVPADEVSVLQEAVERSRAETIATIETLEGSLAQRGATAGPELGAHLAELTAVVERLEQVGRHQDHDVEQAVRRGLGDLDGRLVQIEESVAANSGAWPSSARVLTEAVASLVAQAVGEVGDRVGEIEQRIAALGQHVVDQSAVALQEARGQWGVVETRLTRLEATNGEGRSEATGVADRLERASAATREHLAGLEAGVRSLQDAPPFAARTVVENLAPAIEDVNDRVARLEQALSRLVDQADLRSTTLASELHGVLAAGMDRVIAVATRSEEATAAELHGTRSRLETIAASVAELSAELTSVAEVGRRLADEGRSRPVLEAIDAASRDNGEVLAALHTSITRRIDARMRSIGELIDGLAAPLGATAALAPALGELREAVTNQHGDVERIRSLSEELAGAVGALPGGLAGSFGRQAAALEEMRAAVADRGIDSQALRDAFAGLDASIGRSLEAVRSYLGDGLMHVSRRQAGTGKAMESAAAALQSMERQLNGLAGLCQSLASGVEQQSGASGRVADLVLETRAALRSDVDRLEATVHLEALKLHQQDQARLAGAASATSEVVEREAGLLAQRVSAVAAAVESVRSVLHAHVEDASRAGAVPLALVRDT